MRTDPMPGVTFLDDSTPRAAETPGEILRATSLTKTFLSGTQSITPLDGLHFSISCGEMVAIVGPSGTGKSTLLHLLGALDIPSSGAIYFRGKLLDSLSEPEIAEYRNRSVGFVWQLHHLLQDFTALENVAMPLLLRGVARREALATAGDWLGEVGLADRAAHRSGELSGGEQQRVAIARSLSNSPEILLADEPTGDLDERSAGAIFELMQRLHRAHQFTSIVATHNLSLARRMDRVLVLEHGKLTPGADALAETAASAAGFAGAAVRIS